MASPRTAASALLASPQQHFQQQQQQQQQSMTLEQMAAMQAAQNMGLHFSGVWVCLAVCGASLPSGLSAGASHSLPALFNHLPVQPTPADSPRAAAPHGVAAAGSNGGGYQPAPEARDSRLSIESGRSSFDTGAVLSASRSSSDASVGAGSGGLPDVAAVAAMLLRGGAQQQQQQQLAQQQHMQQLEQQQRVRPSVNAALRRMSAEEVLGSASQQRVAAHHFLQHSQQQQEEGQQQQQQQALQMQQHRAAVDAALQQRHQMLQLQQQAAEAAAGGRSSDERSSVCAQTELALNAFCRARSASLDHAAANAAAAAYASPQRGLAAAPATPPHSHHCRLLLCVCPPCAEPRLPCRACLPPPVLCSPHEL